MIPEFDRMIFNLNDGLHHSGLVPDDYYVTGFHFMMNIVATAVMMIAYKKIVIESEWYQQREELFYDRVPLIVFTTILLVLLLVLLYFRAYGEMVFVMVSVSLTLIIAIRKEFTGFRKWLYEMFGWLY